MNCRRMMSAILPSVLFIFCLSAAPRTIERDRKR